MKKKKRRKNAPFVPPKKTRTEAAADKKARYAATKARIDRAIARTRAGRAERDAFMADADMTDLAELEVVVFPLGRSTPGIRTKHAIDTSPLPAYREPATAPLPDIAGELAEVAEDAKKSAAAIGAVLDSARPMEPRKRKQYGRLNDELDIVKREAITNALDAEQGNISAAAERLGLQRQSLQRLIRDLDITRPTVRKNRISGTETTAPAAEAPPSLP